MAVWLGRPVLDTYVDWMVAISGNCNRDESDEQHPVSSRVADLGPTTDRRFHTSKDHSPSAAISRLLVLSELRLLNSVVDTAVADARATGRLDVFICFIATAAPL